MVCTYLDELFRENQNEYSSCEQDRLISVPKGTFKSFGR